MNAIENARKALKNYRQDGTDYHFPDAEHARKLAGALVDLLESLEYEYAVHTYPSNGASNYTLVPHETAASNFAEGWHILGRNDPEYRATVVRRTKAGEWEKVP